MRSWSPGRQISLTTSRFPSDSVDHCWRPTTGGGRLPVFFVSDIFVSSQMGRKEVDGDVRLGIKKEGKEREHSATIFFEARQLKLKCAGEESYYLTRTMVDWNTLTKQRMLQETC